MNEQTLERCPGCFLVPWTGGRCSRCGYQLDTGAFPTALQPGARLGRYHVGRVLGRPGGFGVTYLAFDSVLNRRVAIKELMPRDLVARKPDGETLHVHTREDEALFAYTLTSFLNEARLIAQFSHPHVVRVLDFFEANGTAYFAMEYYQGKTLAEYVRERGGRIPGEEALALMLPVLDALEHIHASEESILHRDIKPANIYLTDRGTPILLDFGAARMAMGQQSRSLSAVLTPGFAPYEQYSTRGHQGPWTDVYGCAATLYFLVTGQAPPDASERLDNPRLDPPIALAPDLPPRISDAIVSGLGFRPDERPQSARAFADRLTGLEGADPTQIRTLRRDAIPVPRTVVAPGSGDTAALPTEVAGGAAEWRTAVAPGGTRTEPVLPATAAAPASRPLGNARPHVDSGSPGAMGDRAGVQGTIARRWIAAVAAAGVLLVVAVVALALSGGGSGAPQAEPDQQAAGRLSEVPVDLDTSTQATLQTEPAPNPVAGSGEAGSSGAQPGVREEQAPATVPGPAPSTQSPVREAIPADPVGGRQPQNPPAPPAPNPPQREPAAEPAPPDPGREVETARADPPVSATVPAERGVLVIVYGDEPAAARQTETLMLGQLSGREGLRAIDPASVSIVRNDQAAVAAAAGGDFGALAALAREHGIELLVVADISAQAAPSVNRFYTGNAEIDVKMYRVSTGTLVDARTFRSAPQLAASEGAARSQAANEAGSAAAAAVRQWAGRAFR